MPSTTAPAASPAWASIWTLAAIQERAIDITLALPSHVDEVIRTVQLDLANLGAQYDRAVITVRKALGQRSTDTRTGTGRDRRTVTTWPTSRSEAIDAARALPADTRAAYYSGVETIGEALDAFRLVCEYMQEANQIEAEGHAEFSRRNGWARYYRVDNSNGHVHTSTSCRETYPTTAWNWPTQLSDADGAQVVEAAGSLTCLTCFPDHRESILVQRPIRFDVFETPEQRLARTTREAEATARTAAKIAKGVTPDGKPLVIEFDRASYDTQWGRVLEIKTARAAELRYVELAAAAQRSRYTDGQRSEFGRAAGLLVEALAWKGGTTAAEIESTFAKRVEKKLADHYG